MKGVDKFRASEIESVSATDIQRMSFGEPFLVEPDGDFVIGNNSRTRATGDLGGVGHMIGVTVRDENVIGGDLLYVDCSREFVAGDEWVKKQCSICHLRG